MHLLAVQEGMFQRLAHVAMLLVSALLQGYKWLGLLGQALPRQTSGSRLC
jgi:hypothetical protein